MPKGLGAALFLATVLLATTACGGSDSKPSAGPAATALCQKLLDCHQIDSGDLGTCYDGVRSLEMYVIDPEATVDCLTSMTCVQLTDQAAIQACLAYDVSTFECNGGTLHFCNTANPVQCKDIDCDTACRQVEPATSWATCDFDSTDQHDKCMCYL